MPLEVCFGFVVGIEVILGVGAPIVHLQILFRDEELRAVLALVELRSLLSRQLQKVLVRRKCLLLEA